MGSGLSIFQRLTSPAGITAPQRDRYHVVKFGEDLMSIATNEYGLTTYDPTAWRAIAAANSVANPFTFSQEFLGRRIRIPARPLPGFAAATPTLTIGATAPQPREPLGVSVAFPPRPSGLGGFELSADVQAVEDSLLAIITSLIKSHVLEPWLGLPSLVFDPITSTGVIGQLILEAIVRAEDRVDPQSVTVTVGSDAGDLDAGFLPIIVQYSIMGEATEQTLSTGYRVLQPGIRY
jgi:hypothetical protein